MGVLLWPAGYLASMAVYFSPLPYSVWGRVVLVLYIPTAAGGAAWYFAGRNLRVRYYAGVGIVWSLAAVAPGYPFIVLRFGAFRYYMPDVYLYYAIMFLIPAVIGILRSRPAGAAEKP